MIDVRPGLPHELDDEALLPRVGRVHLAVGEPERRVLGADDGGGAPRLLEPDPRDLLAGVDEAAHVCRSSRGT